MLSISDLINGFGNFLGNPHEGGLCQFQAFVISIGSLASVLWTGVIAYSIRDVVLLRNLAVENNMNYYQIAVWGATLVLAFLPFLTKSYGATDGWCWISSYPP